MHQSPSVCEELLGVIERYEHQHRRPPTVVHMTSNKYLRLSAELGYCLHHVRSTRVEWFVSEEEKQGALACSTK